MFFILCISTPDEQVRRIFLDGWKNAPGKHISPILIARTSVSHQHAKNKNLSIAIREMS
jgi:hypothetical protein